MKTQRCQQADRAVPDEFAGFDDGAMFTGGRIEERVESSTGPIKNAFVEKPVEVFARDTERIQIARTQHAFAFEQSDNSLFFGLLFHSENHSENVGRNQ